MAFLPPASCVALDTLLFLSEPESFRENVEVRSAASGSALSLMTENLVRQLLPAAGLPQQPV